MSLTKDPFNAFLDYPEGVVSNAESGPLAGLTLAVKDIFDVQGYRTGCGNPSMLAESKPAAKTAPAIKVLLDAGAQFIGKTQTDELAFSLMGQNSHYPYPINPKAKDRITGGSSSGSAAAVAGGLADIATGSDTGGSIRAPASFCGLIGLRTTHGEISLDGTMPLAPSLDTFGWFAKDMATYRKVAGVLLGATQHPGTQAAPRRPLSIPDLEALLLPEAVPEYIRVKSLVAAVTGEPVATAFPRHAIDDLYWCFRKLQSFEAWQAHGAWLSAKDRNLSVGVKDRFDLARTITARTARSETLHRNDFRDELAGLLGDDGILVLPTVPSCAPRADEPHETLQVYRERALRLLCWSGLSGFPQLSLPLGKVDGAPFGISLLGPAGSDLALLALGQRVLDTLEKV